MSVCCEEVFKKMNAEIAEQHNIKRKRLREMDFIILDNSIRETTVGQLRGHTLENKIKIYEETKKCGFQYRLVAAFNHMTRVGDAFCQWLVDENEDRTNMFGFSEVTEGIKNGRFLTEKVPVALQKCKRYGIPNVQFEFDLADPGIKWGEAFTIEEFCALLLKWLNWCYENLSPNSKVLFGFRDFPFAMSTPEGALRVLKTVKFLGSLSNRSWGISFEEPGKYLPGRSSRCDESMQLARWKNLRSSAQTVGFISDNTVGMSYQWSGRSLGWSLRRRSSCRSREFISNSYESCKNGK